jgi:dipeptidyl aminopeptidase/acylaminoacyl peptidase
MTPDDLPKLNVPSDPRISPNGEQVAFVVSTPNIEDDRYDRRIWLVKDDNARELTNGPGDIAPRWSPDGTRLAFIRKMEGEEARVAVIPLGGGEVTLVSTFEHGVEAIEWAPDGSSLLVVAVTSSEEWADLEEKERERRPRRVTSVPYRYDGRGWTHDRRRHLWLVDPEGESEPRCLTPGDHDEESPSWSPDARHVAFISDRDPRHGLASGNDAWEVDVNTGEVTQVGSRGFWTAVSYRPDGVLHLLGNVDTVYPVDSYLYRREADGSLTDLTGHLDRSSVSPAAGPATLRWDGDDALIGLEDSGMFGVVRVSSKGTVDPIVEGHRAVTGFDNAEGRLVFSASSWGSPGEIYSIVSGTEQQETDLNEVDLDLVEPEHFRVESDDIEVDVWVYLPDGDGTVPLLLNIHGGPASQYGFGFFDEFQVYVGAGYGVVACNPRGSSGRGIDFTRAVVGEGWGDVDLRDIRAVVTAALESFPRLDPERMGVMGGSYGGFMTAWIIGQENRWNSAVVERALISWTSFAGTSDIGGVFPENYTKAPYPEGWSTWWRLGPLSLAEKVATPTLILHSEDDFRCPIEQAEQYFMALLRNGTETEMLRFPGEGHELSRGGTPRHREERFNAVLDWHGRHLI